MHYFMFFFQTTLPFLFVCKQKSETVAMLLDARADADAVSTKTQRTPLLNAVQFRRANVVKLLLQRGAKLELPKGGAAAPASSVVHACIAATPPNVPALRCIIGVLTEMTQAEQVLARLVDAEGRSPHQFATDRFAELDNDPLSEPMYECIELLESVGQ